MATETEKESQILDKDGNDASSKESLEADETTRQQQDDSEAPSAPDEEKQKPPVGGPSPPPNGGLQAWLQVLGGWMLFFNTWGILKYVSST